MAKQNGVEWEKREAKNNQPGFFASPNKPSLSHFAKSIMKKCIPRL